MQYRRKGLSFDRRSWDEAYGSIYAHSRSSVWMKRSAFPLVREDSDIRDTVVIVDRDVHVLPANARRGAAAAAADPVTDLCATSTGFTG